MDSKLIHRINIPSHVIFNNNNNNLQPEAGTWFWVIQMNLNTETDPNGCGGKLGSNEI